MLGDANRTEAPWGTSEVRLIFLKFRYRLGYDSLCREVADSMICGGSAGSRWTAARASGAPSRHRQLGGHGQSADRL